MEHLLQCNELKCKAELRERAVVTTCSHIFCIDCGHRTGVVDAPRDRRVCPACGQPLPRPDDAIYTSLRPSDDYKTSVLSGLTPELIIECAGRALSFWSYQMIQDLTWETHRHKTMTARFNDLNTRLNIISNDANIKITAAQNKLASTVMDVEELRRKNNELAIAYTEKNRKLMQTQELYDKLKRKALLGHIQDAAVESVDNSINAGRLMRAQSIDRGENPVDYQQQFGTPYGGGPRYTDQFGGIAAMSTPRMNHPSMQNSTWARPGPPQADMVAPPSTHRQQLGGDGPGLSSVPGLVAGTPLGLRGEGRMRQPLHEMQTNQRPGMDHFPRAGLSSYLKTGQGPITTATAFAPTVRPRVAQRPAMPSFGVGPNM